MLYDIALSVTYDYEEPSAAARHVLRLMPADIPGEQRLIAGDLVIDPAPDERHHWRDFFGNAAVSTAAHEPHSHVAFRIAARVERLGPAPALDLAPDLTRLSQEVAEYRGIDPDAPHHYLGASPRVRPERAITDYAAAETAGALTALETIQSLGRALHRDMTFDAEVTTVDTAPGEAFARRHGVCQDFTHVMIAGLRGLGVPAGYVSGFLRTRPPPGQARLEGADATHAWVRAWAGVEVGWVEYDPTNACVAGRDHIIIARGRDYADVSPVRGTARSAGSHTTKQAVDVVAL